MRLTCCLLLSSLLGCKGDPLVWSDPVYRNVRVAPREDSSHAIGELPGCFNSLRMLSAGRLNYAAWWQVRPDSSAVLLMTKDDHGFDGAVTVDSTDHSSRGCRRPPPAIAVDTTNGHVFIAYYLEPAAGPGIFFAHSMDSLKTFHSAVPIVFGPNPSRVSLSARGERVVVAYEDPNAQQPLIGIALSKTMGHIFEDRMQATPDNGRAMQPIVRVDGDSIRLWWREYSADSSISATRPAYRAAKWQ